MADNVSNRLRRMLSKNRSSLLHIFQDFDGNNDGLLSIPEIRRGLESLGIRLSQEDAALLMDVIGISEDAELDYREFVAFASNFSSTEDTSTIPFVSHDSHSGESSPSGESVDDLPRRYRAIRDWQPYSHDLSRGNTGPNEQITLVLCG